jgi:hypothetical protein
VAALAALGFAISRKASKCAQRRLPLLSQCRRHHGNTEFPSHRPFTVVVVAAAPVDFLHLLLAICNRSAEIIIPPYSFEMQYCSSFKCILSFCKMGQNEDGMREVSEMKYAIIMQSPHHPLKMQTY